MHEEGLAILFITAFFALDAFLIEAETEKVAGVLVFEGAPGGLERLGGDDFVVREVREVRPGAEGVLRERKVEKLIIRIFVINYRITIVFHSGH